MNALTEYLLAMVELLEAEGRRARLAAARLAAAIALLAAAAAVLAAGVALLLWALHDALRAHLSRGTTALLLGLFALSIAALIAWCARRLVR